MSVAGGFVLLHLRKFERKSVIADDLGIDAVVNLRENLASDNEFADLAASLTERAFTIFTRKRFALEDIGEIGIGGLQEVRDVRGLLKVFDSEMYKRNRLAPVALTGKEPVAELIVDLGFSETFGFGLGGEGFADIR